MYRKTDLTVGEGLKPSSTSHKRKATFSMVCHELIKISPAFPQRLIEPLVMPLKCTMSRLKYCR